jgi:UDP-N-acetylglucosamine transferase subunit ALG13
MSAGNERTRSGRRGDAPILLVISGTDPHPFPRLFQWVGEWARDHRQWQIQVQQPSTGARRFHQAVAHLGSPRDVHALLRRAAVVVSEAEPGTITQARAFGHVPVVVARDPALGERADDEQILLSRRLAAAGLVWLAESEAGLGRAITAALAAAADAADGGGAEPRGGSAEAAGEPAEMRRADRGPRARGRRLPWRRRSRR